MKDKKDLAYKDYCEGMKYKDIANKYKVALSTVKSWYARSWKGMQKNAELNEGRMMDATGTQAPLIQIVPSRNNTDKACFAGLVQKQINDTLPAKIYAEYSRDNLPKITDKEARFVEEYLIDLCKQDAAIRAGYSINNAAALGCKVYDKPDVNAHIQCALAERRKRTGCNADIALQELARISLVNPVKVVSKAGELLESASDDDLAAVQSIKVKSTHTKDGGEIIEREIRFHDKIKALELYMKSAGMLIERKQIDSHVVTEDGNELRAKIDELLSKRQEDEANTFDAQATIIPDDNGNG